LNNKETRTLENSRRHIDNWLNQQFEDFTPNPDAGLWQSIDAALDRKERRSKFIWYWLAAGVLLLVTGVTAIQWNLHKHQQTGATNVAKNNERSLAPTKSHSYK
jgi:type VI protein secretion system component VasF